jgi:hypothetical protein
MPAPERVDPRRVAIIRSTLTQEVLNAAGLPRQWWGQGLVDGLLWLPTRRLALRMARFDADAAGLGFAAASQNLLRGFIEQVSFWGREHIPPQGPLLLACNHPGAYDAFAVVAGLPRDDLRVIASGVDFLRSLPVTSERLIYVTPQAGVRMAAVRQGLRVLQEGRLLFIFPTGLVDPDPALWPDLAGRALQSWSQSVEIFLRRAPQTTLVIAITSHVLSVACARHPLTRLVRQDWQRRRLAEHIQIIQQLAFGRCFGLAPRVSFSPPCALSDLGRSDLRKAILDRAAQALQEHLRRPQTDFLTVSQ